MVEALICFEHAPLSQPLLKGSKLGDDGSIQSPCTVHIVHSVGGEREQR